MSHSPLGWWLTDQHLIARIQQGGADGHQAISLLYMKYRRQVMTSLRKNFSQFPRHNETREDILHDAFLILVQKIETGIMISQSVPAYWAGIARKLLLNQLRKNDRIICVEDPGEYYGQFESSPEDEFILHELEEKLLITFLKLEPRCQRVLELWIQRFTMHEIATMMNLSSDGMARKIKHLCFKKWKELLFGNNSTIPDSGSS